MTDRIEDAIVCTSVINERDNQRRRWGDQEHPDGTNADLYAEYADEWRDATDAADEGGYVTWVHILGEEFAEVLAEEDAARLRAKLLQLAAVAVAWIEDLDQR